MLFTEYAYLQNICRLLMLPVKISIKPHDNKKAYCPFL